MYLFKVTMMPAMHERHYYVVAEDMGEAQKKAEAADSIEDEPGSASQVEFIGLAERVLLGAAPATTDA